MTESIDVRVPDKGDYQHWLEPIEVVEWGPNPDQTGHHAGTIVVKRVKLVGEVVGQLKHRLGFRNGYSKDFEEGLSAVFMADKPWPFPYRRIMVAPVTGGSEGWYVHVAVWQTLEQVHTANPAAGLGKVDLGTAGMVAQTVIIAKTFQGWDHAWKMARILGASLGV